MSYRYLSTPTMVTVTGPWIDPQADRALLTALPQAGALLPSLEKAHKGLLRTQVSEDQALTALGLLQENEAKLDVTHDRKARGGFNVLTGFADLADDPALAAAYLALRDHIYPKGLDMVRWSYTDEAGEAALVEGRLSKADHLLLGKLPTPAGTLLDAVNERIKAGKELGELEKERAGLEKKAPDALTPADVVRARNLWIRSVTAFVATLDLEDALTEADREKILGPLHRAEQKADRRAPAASANASPSADTAAPTPADPGGETTPKAAVAAPEAAAK